MKVKNLITGKFESQLPIRLQKMIGDCNTCIYMLRSPSNKIYVGQTRKIKKRIDSYINLRCKKQPLLFNSLSKYGFFNHEFSIVHRMNEDIDQSFLDQREIYFWRWFKSLGYEMLNVREPNGAHGVFSNETKKKMSLSKIGHIPWNKGKKTGLIPYNKNNGKPRRSYVFYKNGKKIIVNDLKNFCKLNDLSWQCMIELANKTGVFAKKLNKYKAYTTDPNTCSLDKRKRKGENSPNSKFTNEIVNSVRIDKQKGVSNKELCLKYNVAPSTLQDWLSYRTFKNI